MEEAFNLFTSEKINKYVNARSGEIKMGEQIKHAESFEALNNPESRYVIFGIPEDIGVRANHGKAGTASAWDSFLQAFLNIQVNNYNYPKECLLLGEVNCAPWMEIAATLSNDTPNWKQKLAELVQEIDLVVSKIVSRIVSAGKIPIIVGGGHNNAYGNIKGTAEALEKPIDVLNIDAHTDYRKTDYRHSGNGFSFARKEGFLKRYALLGIHKNYTPGYIFEAMEQDKMIDFTFFEDLLHLSTLEKLVKFKRSADFVRNQFGLEIDCDAIANFGSSAMSPSGFSINEIRSMIKLSCKQEVLYLHLCEASPEKHPEIGKALSYFVSDFIRQTE